MSCARHCLQPLDLKTFDYVIGMEDKNMRAMVKAINHWRETQDIPEDFMCVSPACVWRVHDALLCHAALTCVPCSADMWTAFAQCSVHATKRSIHV